MVKKPSEYILRTHNKCLPNNAFYEMRKINRLSEVCLLLKKMPLKLNHMCLTLNQTKNSIFDYTTITNICKLITTTMIKQSEFQSTIVITFIVYFYQCPFINDISNLTRLLEFRSVLYLSANLIICKMGNQAR